jgi:transglutaminase-like putative cysteine protease
MKIRAGFNIAFEAPAQTPLLLLLSLRPERTPDLLTPQRLITDREVLLQAYEDVFGNVCTRALLPAGQTTFSSDFLVFDNGLPDACAPAARQHPVNELPDGALHFLMASRYCETDLLVKKAWDLFGKVEPGWPRVQAIVDYVHDRLSFDYGAARSTRTALEADEEQRGVCRDFAHLAIAFCRCMNIPARYCTGYLGDIGVPPLDSPMDFSAWFEVFLGDGWYTFDARHNQPRIGRILMGIGRDATDVAIATAFGETRLVRFEVVTHEIDG